MEELSRRTVRLYHAFLGSVCSGLAGFGMGHLAEDLCPEPGHRPMTFNLPDPYRHKA
jgi:hypothetical protein